MITQEQAEQLVYERVNRPDPAWPDKPEMIITRTEERALGWVVYWTSRPWHETRDFRHAIAGNGPYLVSREGGTLFETGTAPPIEERILAAERRLQDHLQSRSST
jgi:Immunity protein 35